ncbi:unnamed protein product [Effrenium voratum]|nr:unnamed protein product [Effrenium voratum]
MGAPLRPAYVALIKAFARMRQLELALDLLNSLEDEESSLDLMARAELLEMLARWSSREEAKKVLKQIEQAKKLSPKLYTRMITSCTKAELVDEAIYWFDDA